LGSCQPPRRQSQGLGLAAKGSDKKNLPRAGFPFWARLWKKKPVGAAKKGLGLFFPPGPFKNPRGNRLSWRALEFFPLSVGNRGPGQIPPKKPAQKLGVWVRAGGAPGEIIKGSRYGPTRGSFPRPKGPKKIPAKFLRSAIGPGKVGFFVHFFFHVRKVPTKAIGGPAAPRPTGIVVRKIGPVPGPSTVPP